MHRAAVRDLFSADAAHRSNTRDDCHIFGALFRCDLGIFLPARRNFAQHIGWLRTGAIGVDVGGAEIKGDRFFRLNHVRR